MNLGSGVQAFADRNFVIEKIEYGEKAEASFKKTADHVKSNDATIKYFEKIALRNSIEHVTITEKSTLKDLKLEFKNMYKANKVGSVRDYIRYLDHGEYPMKMFDVIDNQVQFDRILDYLHQDAIREQVKVDPLETLKQFVDS